MKKLLSMLVFLSVVSGRLRIGSGPAPTPTAAATRLPPLPPKSRPWLKRRPRFQPIQPPLRQHPLIRSKAMAHPTSLLMWIL